MNPTDEHVRRFLVRYGGFGRRGSEDHLRLLRRSLPSCCLTRAASQSPHARR